MSPHVVGTSDRASVPLPSKAFSIMLFDPTEMTENMNLIYEIYEFEG